MTCTMWPVLFTAHYYITANFSTTIVPNYSSGTIQTLYTACNSREELEGLGGKLGSSVL